LGGGYMWANLRFLGDKQFTTGWWFGSWILFSIYWE
jgi:hypothetical protein